MPAYSRPRRRIDVQAPRAPAQHRDERAPSVIGRHARLDLILYRNGRTVLAQAYAEPPFRVGRCFAESDGPDLIFTSSAPGAFGNDHLQQIVRVGCGVRVWLTSQSALQVHPSPDGGTAHLQSSYHVANRAHLRRHWHRLIPFADARIQQRIDVNIAGDGSLYRSDALMSDRHARSERWTFASVAHELAVSRDGSLEYLERYRIEPNELAVGRRCFVSRNGDDERSNDRAGCCGAPPYRA